MIRRLASLRRGPRVPRVPTPCGQAWPLVRHRRPSGTIKALRRPAARAASLGFLRLAVPLSAFALFAPHGVSNAPPRDLGLLRFGQPAPMIRLDGDDRNSQVPGEPQRRLRHAQATPVGSHASDRYDAATQAPATGRTRAPALGLSRFSRMALPLAVYASPWRLPANGRKTRFRLLVRLYRTGFQPAGFR